MGVTKTLIKLVSFHTYFMFKKFNFSAFDCFRPRIMTSSDNDEFQSSKNFRISLLEKQEIGVIEILIKLVSFTLTSCYDQFFLWIFGYLIINSR